MGRLEGKVAIITGATGSIGEATAHKFLSEGAKVMLVGRSAERLTALRTEYHQLRQTLITEELLDVVSGFEALRTTDTTVGW